MVERTPQLRRWKTRNIAYVYYNRKKIYFGKWGSREAKNAYQAFLARLQAGLDPKPKDDEPTVAELAVAFFDARANYYVKNGKQTGQLERFKAALEFPLRFYPGLRADEFGPKKLLECRAAMEKSGRFSRTYINALINCVRHVFKFGVENEMVRPDVLTALQAVSPLKRGRTIARERRRIKPVSAADVEKTLKQLSPVVAAMARVQRLTGMRPGEVVIMRIGDLSREGDVLVYTPQTDKTDWRRELDDLKRIPIGPKAQAVLAPYLLEKDGDPEAYLFTPEDAMRDLAFLRREERKTPITKQTRERDAAPYKIKLSPCYDVDSYRRAIERAAKRAGVPRWTPNRLRHLYATEIRAKYGLEASQIMLGHAHADVTQIYAERDFLKAMEVARKEG